MSSYKTDGDTKAEWDRRKKAFEDEYEQLCEKHGLCIGMKIPEEIDLGGGWRAKGEVAEDQVKLQVQVFGEHAGELEL